jgi:acyl-CoA thioesterase-2
MHPDVRPAERMVSYRAARALPDDPALHRYLLAYISDFNFLAVALQPHGVAWLTRGIRMASLDHAIWFHRPFRLDEWLLHVVESPSAAGARGMVRGRIFTEGGDLVATTTQEGVIRMEQWRRGQAPPAASTSKEEGA